MTPMPADPLFIAGVPFGPDVPRVLMAGPCAVEDEAMIHACAAAVAAAGARFLRGVAYKPRTRPADFQGHGPAALGWLRAAADAHGLAVVTEVLSEGDVGAVADAADLLQIGARNAQNYALLRAAGASGRPVLLKRGPAMTLREWRGAVEHLRAAGCRDLLLCERGLRGYEPEYRGALDVAGIAIMAAEGYAVVVDPSHSAGRRDLVLPVLRAGLAAGGCAALVEVHPDPARALSDGPQALTFADLPALAAACGLA